MHYNFSFLRISLFFQREEANSQNSINIYGVIVDGIGESAMTLFQLCLYTVYANQAIQAAEFFIFSYFTRDPKGILHRLAPIARVSTRFDNWARCSILELKQLRNPTQSISDCIYHEYSTARSSSFF